MSARPVPRVGVAMPVYNGENFLEQAIESILSQTFEDLELVISDNASTDATEDICRSFAARDPRVRYHRNAHNVGAAPNYRKAMSLTEAPYVKWAAHDDVCLPEFLERCVGLLDEDPRAVLAHSAAISVDAGGKAIKPLPTSPDLGAGDPVIRFRAALDISEEIFLFWGLMRAAVLGEVPPLGAFVGHDRPLLTALALHGPILVGPEVLFHQREHSDRSVHTHDWRHPREAVVWYDSARAGKVAFPTWRLMAEHARSVATSPAEWAVKLRCLQELSRWAGHRRQALRWDLALAAERLPRVGETMVGLFDRAVGIVRREVPEGEAFILIDDATLETEIFGNRIALPFVEKNGTYWGPPPDDATALAELERQRHQGATMVVIAANCRWWLDHYPGFAEQLERYPLVHAGRHFLIRDLSRPTAQRPA